MSMRPETLRSRGVRSARPARAGNGSRKATPPLTPAAIRRPSGDHTGVFVGSVPDTCWRALPSVRITHTLHAATLRLKREALAIGRPACAAMLKRGVGEQGVAAAIRSNDAQALPGQTAACEHERGPVGRPVQLLKRLAAQDRERAAQERLAVGIEDDLPGIGPPVSGSEGEPPPVLGEAQAAGPRGRCRHRLRRSKRSPGTRVDRDAQQVHRARRGCSRSRGSGRRGTTRRPSRSRHRRSARSRRPWRPSRLRPPSTGRAATSADARPSTR